MTTKKTHNGKRPLPPLTPDVMARFLEKVSIPPGPNGRFECWEFDGHHDKKTGRPRFAIGDQRIYAYRISWILWRNGDRREEVSNVIDHLCGGGSRGCVNPDHLALDTQEKNLLSDPTTIAFKNAHKTECKHGHAYTPENTITNVRKSNGKPYRHCRACKQARERKASAKRGK